MGQTGTMTDASATVSAVDVATARSVPKAATAVGVAVDHEGGRPAPVGPEPLGARGERVRGQGWPGADTSDGRGRHGGDRCRRPRERNSERSPQRGGRVRTCDRQARTSVHERGRHRRHRSRHRRSGGHRRRAARLVPLHRAQERSEERLPPREPHVGVERKAPEGHRDGAERGRVVASAAAFARELANTPPTYLNAKDIAAKAVELAPGARTRRGGVQQGPARADGLWRHARRQPRLDRAAPDGQADLVAEEPDRAPRARRQGRHVRLGRHLAQGPRRVPPEHEDGHVGGRCGARHHERPAGPRR